MFNRQVLDKEKVLFMEYNRIKDLIVFELANSRETCSIIAEAIERYKDDDKKEMEIEIENVSEYTFSRGSKFIDEFIKKSEKIRLFFNPKYEKKYYNVSGKNSYTRENDFTAEICEGAERYECNADIVFTNENEISINYTKDKNKATVIDIKNGTTFCRRVVKLNKSTGNIEIYEGGPSNDVSPYKLNYNVKEDGKIEKTMTVIDNGQDRYLHKGREFDLYGKMLERILKEYTKKPILNKF